MQRHEATRRAPESLLQAIDQNKLSPAEFVILLKKIANRLEAIQGVITFAPATHHRNARVLIEIPANKVPNAQAILKSEHMRVPSEDEMSSITDYRHNTATNTKKFVLYEHPTLKREDVSSQLTRTPTSAQYSL